MDTAKFINDLAAKWSVKHPGQAAKIVRGAMLSLSGKVSPRSLDSWRVIGSKGDEYTVTVTCGYPACTCPDATHRETRCYHMWACALLTRLAAKLEGAIPVTPPKAPRAPLAKSLSALTTKLHDENHERLLSLRPLAPVIPIR